MSWEDNLNALAETGNVAAMAVPAPAYTAGDNEVYATPQAVPTDYNARAGRYEGDLAVATGRINRCGRDLHRFECKHEVRCECGLTERLPLNVQEGL